MAATEPASSGVFSPDERRVGDVRDTPLRVRRKTARHSNVSQPWDAARVAFRWDIRLHVCRAECGRWELGNNPTRSLCAEHTERPRRAPAARASTVRGQRNAPEMLSPARIRILQERTAAVETAGRLELVALACQRCSTGVPLDRGAHAAAVAPSEMAGNNNNSTRVQTGICCPPNRFGLPAHRRHWTHSKHGPVGGHAALPPLCPRCGSRGSSRPARHRASSSSRRDP